LSRLQGRERTPTLTICGDGPEREALEKKARRLTLEDTVSFKGWTSPQALAQWYRQAAVTLVPSRREPFGIVALESIASRCPVVASNVGGLPEAIGDCGVLVEPNRPEALADGIERALQPSTRRVLREAMPAHVDRHRIDRISEEYLDLFNSVIRDTSR
jgi:glycosyltransferase involved in cell wall biosynthesis